MKQRVYTAMAVPKLCLWGLVLFLSILPCRTAGAADGWYVRFTNPSFSGANIAVRVWVNRNEVDPRMTPIWVGLNTAVQGGTNPLILTDYIAPGQTSQWIELTSYIQSRPTSNTDYRACAFFGVQSSPDQGDQLYLTAEVTNQSGGPAVRSFVVQEFNGPLIGWNYWLSDGPYLPTLGVLFPMSTSNTSELESLDSFVQDQYDYVLNLPTIGPRPQRIAFGCETFVGYPGMHPDRFNPKTSPLRSGCRMWDNLFYTYYELGYNTLLGVAQEPGDVALLMNRGVQGRQVGRWAHDNPPVYSAKATELGLMPYIKWMSNGDEIELDLTGAEFTEIIDYVDYGLTETEWDAQFVSHLQGRGFGPDDFIRDEDQAEAVGKSDQYKWDNLVHLAPDYVLNARGITFPTNRPKLLYEGGNFSYYLWASIYNNLMSGILPYYQPGTLTPVNFTPGCQVDARMWFDFFRWGGSNQAWSEDWWWQMFLPGPQWVGHQLSALRLASTHTGTPFQFYCIPYEEPESFERMMAYALAHGTKSIVNWVMVNTAFNGFGGYSLDIEGRSRGILKAVHTVTGAVGKIDEALYEAQPRAAKVALYMNRATNTWDSEGAGRVYNMDNTLYYFEHKAIYAALRSAHIWVDLISDGEIQEGSLDDYEVLYAAGHYMENQTATLIKNWVNSGGVLVGGAGIATKNQYAEPLTELDAVFGITNRSHTDTNTSTSPSRIQNESARSYISYGGNSIPAIIGMETFTAQPGTQVLGTFTDGSPAIVQNQYGQGHAVHWGAYLGLAYILPAMQARDINDAYDYPTQFPAFLRDLIAAPALGLAGIERPVYCDNPLVETILLEGSAGTIVALINFTNNDSTTVTVTMPGIAKVGGVESTFSGALPVTGSPGQRSVEVTFETFEFLQIISENCQFVVDYGYGLASDLNDDCYVNWEDYVFLMADWMRCNDPLDPGCETPTP